ncbi:MAG: hypothetical protein IJL31_00160 [Oscillospiraceae bacterium]|nr:hypothetical protein [Oscillospiraceae bacterium]MBQ6243190.1 hypothetical protein [Bacteroidales bacterium]
MRYLFSEPRRLEALANGKTRCYYDESISEESISAPASPDAEGEQEEGGDSPATVTVYSYAAIDIEGEIDKGRIVGALVRTRYSQDDVEAILRHVIAGDEGAQDEFDAFNTFAEACKAEANRILDIQEQPAE